MRNLLWLKSQSMKKEDMESVDSKFPSQEHDSLVEILSRLQLI